MPPPMPPRPSPRLEPGCWWIVLDSAPWPRPWARPRPRESSQRSSRSRTSWWCAAPSWTSRCWASRRPWGSSMGWQSTPQPSRSSPWRSQQRRASGELQASWVRLASWPWPAALWWSLIASTARIRSTRRRSRVRSGLTPCQSSAPQVRGSQTACVRWVYGQRACGRQACARPARAARQRTRTWLRSPRERHPESSKRPAMSPVNAPDSQDSRSWKRSRSRPPRPSPPGRAGLGIAAQNSRSKPTNSPATAERQMTLLPVNPLSTWSQSGHAVPHVWPPGDPARYGESGMKACLHIHVWVNRR